MYQAKCVKHYTEDSLERVDERPHRSNAVS